MVEGFAKHQVTFRALVEALIAQELATVIAGFGVFIAADGVLTDNTLAEVL